METVALPPTAVADLALFGVLAATGEVGLVVCNSGRVAGCVVVRVAAYNINNNNRKGPEQFMYSVRSKE